MKIVRKNAMGQTIEELEVTNIDIIKDAIVIKEPKFVTEEVKVEKVNIVEKDRIVEVPVFKKTDVFFEKLNIIKKDFVIDVARINYIEKTVNDVKIKEETRTVILYDFVIEKKIVPLLEYHTVKVPKIVEVDTPVPKIREVEKTIDKVVYNTVVVDKPVYNTREINTCIVNHVCPHCGKKSVEFLKSKKKEKDV